MTCDATCDILVPVHSSGKSHDSIVVCKSNDVLVNISSLFFFKIIAMFRSTVSLQ